jgi:hypothetical protein
MLGLVGGSWTYGQRADIFTITAFALILAIGGFIWRKRLGNRRDRQAIKLTDDNPAAWEAFREHKFRDPWNRHCEISIRDWLKHGRCQINHAQRDFDLPDRQRLQTLIEQNQELVIAWRDHIRAHDDLCFLSLEEWVNQRGQCHTVHPL